MKWHNFILFYGWLFHYVYDFLSQSSVDRHLGSFHVLAIVSSAAINIGVHISLKLEFSSFLDIQVDLMVKNLPVNAGHIRDTALIPGSEDPLRRGWQPTPVFLPRESHGQRNLQGYNSWSHRIRQDWSNLACAHPSLAT